MKPNISHTVQKDLCVGCGICEGACPKSAIQIVPQKGLFRPFLDDNLCNNDHGCHRCYDVCPGLGVDIKNISKDLFPDKTIKDHVLLGRYIKCFYGYSNDYNIRFHAASGGLLSQFLIYLLEKNLIDGAVVTKFDPHNEFLVKSFIATTKNDILSAKSSKYSPVTMNHIVQDIKSSNGNRFILVGLPCHLHGFRKLEMIDKSFKEKIVGHFGLYCSGNKNFYFTEYLLEERNISKSSIDYIAYRDEGNLGGLVINGMKDSGEKFHYYQDYRKYNHPLRSFFLQKRCLFCVDHFAELADLSFGDLYTEPFKRDKVGINSLIVRSSLMLEWLKQARSDGAIYLNDLNEELLLKSQPASYNKKRRTKTFLRLNSLFGKTNPQYDVKLQDKNLLRSVVAYFYNLLQIYIGRNKSLWWMIKICKKKI